MKSCVGWAPLGIATAEYVKELHNSYSKPIQIHKF